MTFCTGDPKKKKLFRPVHFTILKSGWTLFVLNRFGFYTCVKKPVWHCLIEVTKTQLNLVQYGSIQFGYCEQKPCWNLSFQAIKTRFNPVRFDTFLGFYESMLNSYAKSRLNTVKTFWTGFNRISLSGEKKRKTSLGSKNARENSIISWFYSPEAHLCCILIGTAVRTSHDSRSFQKNQFSRLILSATCRIK